MLLRVLLLLLVASVAVRALAAAPAGAPDVYIAYPDPGATVPFDHVILEGSVSPGGDLRIGGRPVPVGPDGLFMEWWPLRPGVNTLSFVTTRAGRRGTATLRIVRPVVRALPARPTVIEAGSVRPDAPRSYWDAPGDTPDERTVTVSFRGSPGGQATYRLAGSPPVPLREGPAGTYTAAYTLPSTARLLDAAFTVSLRGRDGRTVTATARGRVTSTPGGVRVATQRPGSVRGLALNDSQTALSDARGRSVIYPRDGMTFAAVGREGPYLRVRLAPGVSVYADPEGLDLAPGRVAAARGGAVTVVGAAPAVAELAPVAAPPVSTPAPALPPATPDPVPATVPDPAAPTDAAAPLPELPAVPAPSTTAPAVPQTPPTPPSGDLLVRVPLGGARLPYTLEQGVGDRLVLTLYGSFAAPLGGLAGAGDPLLRGVEVQPGRDVSTVTLLLAPGQRWGFHAAYDGGDVLVRVRRAPALDVARPLAGRVIVLDPGHGGSQKGGAGSLRVPEKGLVLPIALRAADLLRAQGATVRVTRTADVTLGLYDRGLIAEGAGADLLVSLHGNALPDGRDPRGVRGPEVYYTHPQAQALSAAILAALRRGVPELGPGAGLKGGADFALTRPSAQPSVLVEMGYLTDAGNLRLLHSPAGQERLAQAVAAGIADYYAAQAR